MKTPNALVICVALTAALMSAPLLAQTEVPTTTPGSRPAERSLTLAGAVEAALRSSPALQASAREVLKARGGVNESRTAFLPTLSADLALTHLDEGVTTELAPGQTITIVKQDQKSASVTAALPLDVFGMIRAATSLSEFQYLIARLDYNRLRNQLVQDVTAAYYDVLRTEAFVNVANQAEANAQERVRISEAHLKAGTGTKFDVVRAQTELANAQQGVLSARNRVSLAQAALNRLVGFDQATPLKLAAPPAQPVDDSLQIDAALQEAYRTRPEALQADAGIRAAEKGLVLANRSVLPSIGLAWNLQHTPDTGAFGRKTSWSAVVRATVPLFDAGLSNARKQQARAGVEGARFNRQQALDGIALDVRQAYLDHRDATERLKVAEAGLVQATEAYRLAQVRYKAGVTMTPGGSPLLEISDAQTALTQAQTNHINAMYDIETARTRLLRAIGRFAYTDAPNPGLSRPGAANAHGDSAR